MIKHLIVLPDGSEICSGINSEIAIMNTNVTTSVNSQTELTIGSVCAAMAELRIFTPHGELNINEGTEFELYKLDVAFGEDIIKEKVGLFTAEKPVRTSANTLTVTAYDRVIRLDKDLTAWVQSLEEWPYTVDQMAMMVCSECGVGIATEVLPNGGYLIHQFSGNGITGRRIMQWIGEISGKFCRATPEGSIEFAWYAPFRDSPRMIGPNSFFSGSLSYADFQTHPIEQVQIQLSTDDIGVVWPQDLENANTYKITGNYLLASTDPDALAEVASNLYDALKDVSYVPGSLTVDGWSGVDVGEIITVQDINGASFPFWVMTKTVRGQRITLESTGSPRRNSTTVLNEESFRAMNAKMLEIRKDISGLLVRATETETRIEDNRAYTDEKIAEVTIQADGIASMVESVREMVDGVESQISSIQQTADSIALQVETIQDNGVDRLKTSFGMTIEESAVVIARSGADIENRLDETGMYVTRTDGTVVLKAAADGVETQNLQVRGYADFFGLLRKQAWKDEQGRTCVATLWTGG